MVAVGSEKVEALREALREWWNEVMSEELIVDTSGDDSALWNSVPVMDSKKVADSSFIFKRHLDVDLDTRLIRPGGYSDVESMISDLVPKMVALANKAGSAR